jgi:hypothetical protein
MKYDIDLIGFVLHYGGTHCLAVHVKANPSSRAIILCPMLDSMQSEKATFRCLYAVLKASKTKRNLDVVSTFNKKH